MRVKLCGAKISACPCHIRFQSIFCFYLQFVANDISSCKLGLVALEVAVEMVYVVQHVYLSEKRFYVELILEIKIYSKMVKRFV